MAGSREQNINEETLKLVKPSIQFDKTTLYIMERKGEYDLRVELENVAKVHQANTMAKRHSFPSSAF